MYAQVKTAEASRKKQDQVVTRLQSELEAMKRDNARRLKVHLLHCITILSLPMLWTGCSHEGKESRG